MKLKFDKTYFIENVVIYYRFYINWYNIDDYCVQDTSRFTSCVDSQNNVDVSVYKEEVRKKSCGTLQLTYGLLQSYQIYTLTCNKEGDQIRLEKPTTYGSDSIVVCEIVTTTATAGTVQIIY